MGQTCVVAEGFGWGSGWRQMRNKVNGLEGGSSFGTDWWFALGTDVVHLFGGRLGT